VTAIGKDFLDDTIIDTAPSGQGYLLSVGGLAGVLLSAEEGLELNLLGFSAGIDLSPPALKLPGLGRLGYSDFKRPGT